MIDLRHGDCLKIIPIIQRDYYNRKIIVVSDPPFNINKKYRTYSDNLKEQEYLEFMKKVFSDYPSVIIHYPEPLYKIASAMNKFPMRVVSWVYNSNTAKQSRHIGFFDVIPDFSKVRQPYKNPNDKRIKNLIAKGNKGARLYDWWNINQVKNVSKNYTNHPCIMPLEVMKNIIGILPNDVVILDPFMGTGTTGVACKELGVDFVGIELDKEYFEIAKERVLGENIK